MNCPTCNITLQIAERQGVEIDFCPQCRGVWLDRGELDKIIERQSQTEDRSHPGYIPPSPPPPTAYRGDSDRRDYDRDYDKDYKKKKKKSFLDDIFDF